MDNKISELFIKAATSIEIHNTAETTWTYTSNPENWTASNPKEHLGLVFFNEKNRPLENTHFHQREKVAGVYADLKGIILYVDYPHKLVWNGTARYKILGGLIKLNVAEGGVLQLQEYDGHTTLSHDVYMQFPDSIIGKFWHYVFTNIFNARKAVYDHTYRELEFFKSKLDLKK